jgi:hypothetical protein
LISRTTNLLVAFPVGKLMAKMGPQVSLITGHILLIISLLLLTQARAWPWIIPVSAIFEGFQVHFFWNTIYELLAKNTINKHLGHDLSLIQFLLQLVSLMAPALGGFIATAVGFEWVLVGAVMTTVLNIIVSLFIKDYFWTGEISWGDFKSMTKEPFFKTMVVGTIGRYINDSSLLLWPLYVFALMGSFERVGFLYTFSLFLSLLVVYFVGVYIDKTKNPRGFWVSGGILSFLWLVRVGLSHIWTVAVVDTLDRVTSNFHWVIFDALMLKQGKKDRTLSFFVYREFILSCIGVVFWGGLLLVALVLPFTWNGLFILAAIGVILSITLKNSLEQKLAE